MVPAAVPVPVNGRTPANHRLHPSSAWIPCRIRPRYWIVLLRWQERDIPESSEPAAAELAVNGGETARPDHRVLVTLLRAIGLLDLCAFLAVLAPVDWLAWAHRSLGFGEFPASLITHYLARSASLLYGFCGVLLLFLSSDVNRYRPVIRFMAFCGLAASGVLLATDLAVGMPLWWTALEGPGCAVLWGLVLLAEARNQKG